MRAIRTALIYQSKIIPNPLKMQENSFNLDETLKVPFAYYLHHKTYSTILSIQTFKSFHIICY